MLICKISKLSHFHRLICKWKKKNKKCPEKLNSDSCLWPTAIRIPYYKTVDSHKILAPHFKNIHWYCHEAVNSSKCGRAPPAVEVPHTSPCCRGAFKNKSNLCRHAVQLCSSMFPPSQWTHSSSFIHSLKKEVCQDSQCWHHKGQWLILPSSWRHPHQGLTSIHICGRNHNASILARGKIHML